MEGQIFIQGNHDCKQRSLALGLECQCQQVNKFVTNDLNANFICGGEDSKLDP